MSIFVDNEKKQLQFGDLVVVIRKLSGSSLRKAQQARQAADMANFRAMGGELFRVMREPAPKPLAIEPGSETAEQARARRLLQAKKDRYNTYDRDDMLVRGIESWSDTRDIATGVLKIADGFQQQIYEEIVDLALGPVDEAELEEGKD